MTDAERLAEIRAEVAVACPHPDLNRHPLYKKMEFLSLCLDTKDREIAELTTLMQNAEERACDAAQARVDQMRAERDAGLERQDRLSEEIIALRKDLEQCSVARDAALAQVVAMREALLYARAHEHTDHDGDRACLVCQRINAAIEPSPTEGT